MDSTSTALFDRWIVAEAEMTLAMQSLVAVLRREAAAADSAPELVSGAGRPSRDGRHHLLRRVVARCRTALRDADGARHDWQEWEDALPRLRFARWLHQQGRLSG